jgi:hypothetical protein
MTANTNTQTTNTAASGGFWHRLWQRIRGWGRRQETCCCDATTQSSQNTPADKAAQQQKAAA